MGTRFCMDIRFHFTWAYILLDYVITLLNSLKNCQSVFQSVCGSADKESACNAGDLGSIPALGRFSGEGKGYPLQSSGPENSMDCIDHGVTTLSCKVEATPKGRNASFGFKILLPVFDLRVFRLFQLTCVFNLILDVVLSRAVGSVQPTFYPHPLSWSTNYTPHTRHLHSLHPSFSLHLSSKTGNRLQEPLDTRFLLTSWLGDRCAVQLNYIQPPNRISATIAFWEERKNLWQWVMEGEWSVSSSLVKAKVILFLSLYFYPQVFGAILAISLDNTLGPAKPFSQEVFQRPQEVQAHLWEEGFVGK